jgi:hypothetical protein
MKPKFLRSLILALAVLANLAIARVAAADLKNSYCEDVETGHLEPCCDWCFFFCGCDYQP